jgi:hypothetical protein
MGVYAVSLNEEEITFWDALAISDNDAPDFAVSPM